MTPGRGNPSFPGALSHMSKVSEVKIAHHEAVALQIPHSYVLDLYRDSVVEHANSGPRARCGARYTCNAPEVSVLCAVGACGNG